MIPLSRAGAKSDGRDGQVQAGVLLELIAAAISPPTLLCGQGASVGPVKLSALATRAVGENTDGARVWDVGVATGVVPDVDLLGSAGAVAAGEGAHLVGVGAVGCSSHESQSLDEMHLVEKM